MFHESAGPAALCGLAALVLGGCRPDRAGGGTLVINPEPEAEPAPLTWRLTMVREGAERRSYGDFPRRSSKERTRGCTAGIRSRTVSRTSSTYTASYAWISLPLIPATSFPGTRGSNSRTEEGTRSRGSPSAGTPGDAVAEAGLQGPPHDQVHRDSRPFGKLVLAHRRRAVGTSSTC